MTAAAIHAVGLGKRYRIGAAATPGESVLQRVRHGSINPLRYLVDSLREPAEDEVTWAVRDVSFDIAHGEIVGLIGANGAGKSSLLRVLSRITEPSEGYAEIHGRIGSLLEVGTGFHPELTGRENVFMNGAILGMTRAEIRAKFDEIVQFAGVGKFIDTPVKRYSSGMTVRLGFAVAAHLEPEILLVDEVLSVGDAAFQKRCLGKMSDVASQGRTIVFVSHNLLAVQRLCDRTLWLRNGALVDDGPTNAIVTRYLESELAALPNRVVEWSGDDAPGHDSVRIRRVAVAPARGDAASPILTSTPVTVEVDYDNMKPGARLHVVLHVSVENEVVAFATSSHADPTWRDRPMSAGRYRSRCSIPGGLLNSGDHRIGILLVEDQTSPLFRERSLLSFRVEPDPASIGAWHGRPVGIVHPTLDWATTPLPAVDEALHLPNVMAPSR